MITRIPGSREKAPESAPGQTEIRQRSDIPEWQKALANAVSNLDELLDLVGLDRQAVQASTDASADFPLRVPRGFVDRMRVNDPTDPLLLQVLPTSAELVETPGFCREPLAEEEFVAAPGLLHKYHGRVLLMITGACAIHCRYCFRRNFDYSAHQLATDCTPALAYIAADPSIEEVIFSGGDPLAVNDRRLAALAEQVAAIPHVRRLRIHSRLPIVVPERVDSSLLGWLRPRKNLSVILVLHANHSNEIDNTVTAALVRMRAAGVTLLNQSVLLRGVNDDIIALCNLSQTLFESGVLPYYLHVLDPVQGAAQFEIGVETARKLVQGLMQEMPGYLVPRLVQERPGAPAKVPICITGF